MAAWRRLRSSATTCLCWTIGTGGRSPGGMIPDSRTLTRSRISSGFAVRSAARLIWKRSTSPLGPPFWPWQTTHRERNSACSVSVVPTSSGTSAWSIPVSASHEIQAMRYAPATARGSALFAFGAPSSPKADRNFLMQAGRRPSPHRQAARENPVDCTNRSKWRQDTSQAGIRWGPCKALRFRLGDHSARPCHRIYILWCSDRQAYMQD